MRVHSMNCVTMCPPGRRLMDGRKGAHGPALLSCHCLLIEAGDRLILCDTGFGLEDVRRPRERLDPMFRRVLCRPRLREEDTAVRQIAGLGFDPGDVTDIVLTHLDFDHAGGLDDFPGARVHLLEEERDAAMHPANWRQRRRYRRAQWGSMDRWLTYRTEGETWFGFEAVCELEGLPPEILMIPLVGHTLGHAGIAVREGDRWLLHAGDAYFFHEEMHHEKPRCPSGLRFYQWLMEEDRAMRLANQHRLRTLAREHGDRVRIFCAHDIAEFEALAAGVVAPWAPRRPVEKAPPRVGLVPEPA